MKNLRVWNVINPPNKAKHYKIETIEDALILINSLAQTQLKDDSIVANAFGLETPDDIGIWEEWEDEEGNDIDAYELVDGKAVLKDE